MEYAGDIITYLFVWSGPNDFSFVCECRPTFCDSTLFLLKWRQLKEKGREGGGGWWVGRVKILLVAIHDKNLRYLLP